LGLTRVLLSELRLVTIFLTISALMNIGLGYWLATYLAREKARATAVAVGDDHSHAVVEEHEAQTLPLQAALPMELPTPSAAMPAAPQQVAAAMPAMPTSPVTQTPVAAEVSAASPIAPAAEAPEIETEVLAGIEEFRNQLAQMKASPEGAEPVAASV
jgi:hypothetical protein